MDLLFMHEIDNETRKDVLERVKKAATMACELRCELEEPQQIMFNNDCEIICNDGDTIDCYVIEDSAAEVGKLEDALFNDK